MNIEGLGVLAPGDPQIALPLLLFGPAYRLVLLLSYTSLPALSLGRCSAFPLQMLERQLFFRVSIGIPLDT